jgi:hypothetical protein
MEYIIGAIIITLLVAGIAYTIWKRIQDSKPVPPMHNWTSIGVSPPPGFEVAMEVIKSRLDWVPPDKATYGGVIQWVAEPYYSGGQKVAGTLESLQVPHIKVVAFPYIWETALAHEILHIYWFRCYGTSGDGQGDFYSMVSQINRDIRARLA